MVKEIYLDNSATTGVDPRVARIIYDTMLECYGNPSSLYDMGVAAKNRFDNAAKQVGALIGAPRECIYFTSGGTESNNWAIFGTVEAKRKRGNRIVTTAFEHASVLEPLRRLEKAGMEVIFVRPNSDGVITAADFLAHVNAETILASFMLINNEVGTVLPYAEIATGVKQIAPNATVHCDAVQAFGKLPIKIEKTDIDLLSMSGHKIHAPKGVGALYIKKGVNIAPFILGGAQQGGKRPGTESLPLAVGMGFAAELRQSSQKADLVIVTELRAHLAKMLEGIEGVKINARDTFAYIMNISVEGIRSETMLHFLEAEGIYVSSASACGKGAPSHVLAAMSLSPQRIDSALRISLNATITNADLDHFVKCLRDGINSLQRAKNGANHA